MCGHDAGHSGLDRRPERRHLYFAQPCEIEIQPRQINMAIHRRIAVAREMLRTRRHSAGLERRNERASVLANGFGVLRKAAIADHGVVRIAIDIHDRRKVEIESATPKLPGERCGEARRVRRSPITQNTHGRPFGPGSAQTLHAATFLVQRHSERCVRRREIVQVANERLDFIRRSDVS